MSTFKIAIDGPAGAGKSTIAKRAAKELKFVYIDTGAMYRAIGLAAIRAGVDPNGDIAAVEALLETVKIDIAHSEAGQQVFLNGEDVSTEIRLPEVSVAASDVSKIPAVRSKLLDLQRSIAEKTDVIMDGRDIGTVILPDADVKIFMSADEVSRAKRRYKELIAKGEDVKYEDVLREMIERDNNDRNRDVAPAVPASDAVMMDNSNMSVEENIDAVIDLIRSKGIEI